MTASVAQDPAVVALRAEKRAARATAGTARAAAAARLSPAKAGILLRDRLLAEAPFIAVRKGTVVSGFWPMGDEIDPRPALLAYAERGAVIAFPVVVAKRQPLVFRAWDPMREEGLDSGVMGTRHPPPSAPEVRPDIVLAALLSFDDAGRRLGYGGGFYDRTLAALKASAPAGAAPLAVGVAYAAQRVARVPTGPGDVLLDAVATEAYLLPITDRTRTRP